MRTVLSLFFMNCAFHITQTHTPLLNISSEQQKIIEDLSWPLKIKLYNSILDDNIEAQKQKNMARKPLIGTQKPPIKAQKPQIAAQTPKARRVGLESQVLSLRLHDLDKNDEKTQNEDEAIKIKLFRLMYEVVRENELKVRRANMVKTIYKDSPDFNMGFLTGAINDKFEAMLDVEKTLKKFHDKWLPIDHINAYEQISNQAVEIGNLIDMIRTMSEDRIMNYTSPAVVKYVQDM